MYSLLLMLSVGAEPRAMFAAPDRVCPPPLRFVFGEPQTLLHEPPRDEPEALSPADRWWRNAALSGLVLQAPEGQGASPPGDPLAPPRPRKSIFDPAIVLRPEARLDS
ncbi:MAG: hypothetical protein U0746_21360 [Gemmataceae bacterium]